MTLDAHNVNKALQPAHRPIPRLEDIWARLAGAKLNFKSAFWQLELHPDSSYLTVLHANNKLYRYRRLTMGLNPSHGELNVALRPLFAHIPQAHLTHDDLIISTRTHKEHNQALCMAMERVNKGKLTLNPKNVVLENQRLSFGECL